METELSEIKTILQCQSAKINDIHFAIYGNEKAGVNGMADKLKEHDKYIESDKKQKFFLAGIVTIIASAISAFWSKLFN